MCKIRCTYKNDKGGLCDFKKNGFTIRDLQSRVVFLLLIVLLFVVIKYIINKISSWMMIQIYFITPKV